MRALPVAATLFLGLTFGAAAQMMGPGMGFPGAGAGMPGFGAAPPPQQQQEPPCFKGLRAAARRGREARQRAARPRWRRRSRAKRPAALFKTFSAAEAKVVKFVTANAQTCGIPPQAVTQMKANHDRTMKTQTQVCSAAAGPPKPTGPGLSEALGTDARRHARSARTAERRARHADRERARPMSEIGRVADSTGNWVDTLAPPGRAPICVSRAPTGRSARGCCCCRAGGRRALRRSRPGTPTPIRGMSRCSSSARS